MSKTNISITPGGRPYQENPLSKETGPTDSGGGQQLSTENAENIYENLSIRKLVRSPILSGGSSPRGIERTNSFGSGSSIKSIDQSYDKLQVQALQNELLKVIKEKNQQDVLLNTLRQQLDELKKELTLVKQNQHSSSDKIVTEDESVEMDYHTDEEELAKETEWIRVKNSKKNKKRKLNNTPSPIQIEDKRNQPKSQQLEKKDKSEPIIKKVSVPPPIIVDEINNYNDFFDIIKQNIPDGSLSIKVLHQNSIKINVSNEEAYRKVIETLHQGQFIYHTYENKQQRPIRVMIKNLHHSCSTTRIIDDLLAKNFPAIEAMNKRSWRKKMPLDMFIVSFSPDIDVEKIYKITGILGCKVQIEPLRKSKLIPQCKKCQAYGHTQKYCSKNPRCVKCAGNHLTATCILPRKSKARCVHCGEQHPASYRGCIIAKEMQMIKNKRMNKIIVQNYHSNDKREPKRNSIYPNPKNTNATYADIVTGQKSSHTKPQRDDADIKQTLHTILMKLTKFDERLEKLENSVKGAKPKSNRND